MTDKEEETIEEEQTQKEERVTLKSLKKEFDDFKVWVAEELTKRLPEQNLPPVHGFAHKINPEDVSASETPAKSSITFNLTGKFEAPRTFSEETNGPKWRELAQSFYENNSHKINKRIHN